MSATLYSAMEWMAMKRVRVTDGKRNGKSDGGTAYPGHETADCGLGVRWARTLAASRRS